MGDRAVDGAAAWADAAFAEAAARAGAGLTCRAGCDDCCRRPFAITAADAQRLALGLAELPAEEASSIRRRAEASWSILKRDFPGDTSSARLTENPEWREWFFARAEGQPCPALDPSAGLCLLRDHRPVACRLYGPLIQIGNVRADPCPKCFPGATAAEIEGTLVQCTSPSGDPEDETGDPEGETIVAAVLANAV